MPALVGLVDLDPHRGTPPGEDTDDDEHHQENGGVDVTRHETKHAHPGQRAQQRGERRPQEDSPVRALPAKVRRPGSDVSHHLSRLVGTDDACHRNLPGQTHQQRGQHDQSTTTNHGIDPPRSKGSCDQPDQDSGRDHEFLSPDMTSAPCIRLTLLDLAF